MAHRALKLPMLGWVLVGLCLLTAAGAAQPDFSEALVEFREAAQVSGDAIYLSDVADTSGSEEAVTVLDGVYVGRAPLAGSTRTLNQGHVEVRLRQAGINPRHLSLSGAPSITITRRVDAVEESAEPPESAASAASAEPAEPAASQVSVVVAAVDISRGDILDENSLRIEYREQTGRVVETSVEDFLGKRATRYVRQGQVLVAAAAEVPPVIDRGATVYILAEVGSVRVTVPGKARDAGGLGETIRVQNSASRQVVEAVVVDADHVAVAVKGAGGP